MVLVGLEGSPSWISRLANIISGWSTSQSKLTLCAQFLSLGGSWQCHLGVAMAWPFSRDSWIKTSANEFNSFTVSYMDDILFSVFQWKLIGGYSHCSPHRFREIESYSPFHKRDSLKDRVGYLGFRVFERIPRFNWKREGCSRVATPTISAWDQIICGVTMYYKRIILASARWVENWMIQQKRIFHGMELERKMEFRIAQNCVCNCASHVPSKISQQFVLTTNEVDDCVVSILERGFHHGLLQVSFAARKLNGAKLLLGILWVFGQWRHYFQGSHSTIVWTDL